ncbi:CU044_2847 family protein [Streptomyces sp. B6B3]|uniref:CU044_2847 family protein n=1 Tax=Streptomyces sp. B6B3 TaxID=3153570 RepID=UPI00325D67D9
MSGEVTRIHLPDGTPVWARISDAGLLDQREREERPGSTYADTALGDQVAARVESLRGLISGVAASVAAGARAARPDEVSVSFGIELSASPGRVVALLADGGARAAITVTLSWQGAPPDDVGQAG